MHFFGSIFRASIGLTLCLGSSVPLWAEDGRYEPEPDGAIVTEVLPKIKTRTFMDLTLPDRINRPNDPGLALVWSGSTARLKTKPIAIGLRFGEGTDNRYPIEAVATYQPGSIIVRIANTSKYSLRGGIRAVLNSKKRHQQTRVGIDGGHEIELFFPSQDPSGGVVFGLCPRKIRGEKEAETKSYGLRSIAVAIEGSAEAKLVTGNGVGTAGATVRTSGSIAPLKNWRDQKTTRSPEAFIATGPVNLQNWQPLNLDHDSPAHISGLRAGYDLTSPAGAKQSGFREQRVTILPVERSALGLSNRGKEANPAQGTCFVVVNRTVNEKTFSNSVGE